jgi:vancomycin resistance protein VanJ
LWTHGYGAGMALLSQFPIIEHGKLTTPPTLWARLCMGEGRQLMVVSAHPTFFPPRPEGDVPKPPRTLRQKLRHVFDPRFLRYRTAHRDDGIRQVRVLVDQLLAEDAPLLLVGDFNVTEREQAYHELAVGLNDVHRAVGTGSGHTWRPEWLARWPLALLRIDYMWCNSALKPLRMSVDRTPRGSDHSLIHGVFAFVGTNSPTPTFSTQSIHDI